MKRELTQDNIVSAIRSAGYDPEQANWPGYVGIVAPTPGAVTAVMRALGYTSFTNRHARVVVGSTMQSMMRPRHRE